MVSAWRSPRHRKYHAERLVAQTHKVDDNARVGDGEPIGQRIKRERLRRSMTQRSLAEAVGVGVPHISKVEAGRENPSDDLVGKIAMALECDIDEFMLAARRVPSDLLDRLAADPHLAVEYLRQWRPDER